jgi:hypothetical protein
MIGQSILISVLVFVIPATPAHGAEPGVPSNTVESFERAMEPLTGLTLLENSASQGATGQPLATNAGAISHPSSSRFLTDSVASSRISQRGRSASCVEASESTTIPLFLWTEVPKEELGVSPTKWRAFYTRMLNFVLGNCINSRTTRLILRVIHPNFPVARPMWNNLDESPLFTELLSKLPDDIDLQLYPYLGGRSSPAAWATQSTLSDPLDGVFNYAVAWNTKLASLNITSRFTGIVLDLEEDYPWDWTHIAGVKANHSTQIPSLGVSIGFDEIVKLKRLAPFVDDFYMQMYDFYTREVRHVTSNYTTSPFVLYRDNPVELANWLKAEVLADPDLFAIYRRYRKQIYVMWSTQNRGSSDCIYPLRGTCGSHYEFGLFSAKSFNQFIRLITTDPQFLLFHGVQGHGLFEFDLIRNDWIPV